MKKLSIVLFILLALSIVFNFFSLVTIADVEDEKDFYKQAAEKVENFHGCLNNIEAYTLDGDIFIKGQDVVNCQTNAGLTKN